VLRRIFGPKRDEVTGKWRRLHNKELHSLYSSPDIIRVIKSRRLRWAGNAARMAKGKMHTRFSVENLRERNHLKNACVDGRILNLISEKWNGGMDWICGSG
jgi:hypothetical protein